MFQWRSVCEPCLRRGRKTACEHELVNDPPWIQGDGDGFLQTVMSAEGHAREILGVGGTDAERKMFEHEDCAAVAQPANRVEGFRGAPAYFYTAVDPGGGSSDFAILSLVVQGDAATVRYHALHQARTNASTCGSRGTDDTHCSNSRLVRSACASSASSVVAA